MAGAGGLTRKCGYRHRKIGGDEIGGGAYAKICFGDSSRRRVFAPHFPRPSSPPTWRGDSPLAVAPDAWHFEATLDGWAPGLGANLGVLDFSDLLGPRRPLPNPSALEGIDPFTVVGYNDNFIVARTFFGFGWGWARPSDPVLLAA